MYNVEVDLWVSRMGFAFCGHGSIKRAQLSPGVQVEEFSRKECDPLGGVGTGSTWKEAG